MPPTLEQTVLDAELIADATNNEIDHVLYRLRARVIRGHCWHDDRARFGDGNEILQRNQPEWRFPRHEHELATLL